MTRRRSRRPPDRSPAPPPTPTGGLAYLPLFLVLAGAAALHAPAVRAPFFADDYLFLDQVRDRGLFAVLASGDPIGNFLRPVGRQLHFWLWSHAGGESPVVFHLVNLALFLGAVALLYELVRRVAGRGAAIVAAAFLAFHYAADVPALWASGSQDLIALAGGLGAVLLAARGRAWWAAASFAAAVLSKETAAGVPLLCLLAAHRRGESLGSVARRMSPVLVAFAAWAAWWTITLPSRGAAAPSGVTLSGALAALAHLPQVALGLEWRADGSIPTPALVWALFAAAVGAVAAWLGAGEARPTRRAWLLAAGFAALGTAPVILVAPIWSAYFYLLALCGVGLALGLLVGRSRPAAAAVVAILAFASAQASAVNEFSTELTPWTRLSHVNRRYLDRAMDQVARYLVDLRRLRPTLPPRSTLFFGNFPSFLGWQAGDGPLVRWAYRDSSLRSYFASSFSPARAARGPYFFFLIEHDALREETNRAIILQNLWYTRALYLQWRATREIIEIALPLAADPSFSTYWLAYSYYGEGDTANAVATLRRMGLSPTSGPSPELAIAERVLAEGDSTAAMGVLAAALPRHALDPAIHSRMADLLLADRLRFTLGSLEAALVTVLAPREPRGWRRLAVVQMLNLVPDAAERSLKRYYETGGAAARADTAAARIERAVRSALPGGTLTQKGIRD